MANRNVFAALFVAMLVLPSLRGDESALRPSDISGKWIATKIVIDGREIPPSKLSDPFWELDDPTWRYSFVVSGKRASARFKVTLTTNDTDIFVDAKLQNGAFAGGVCKGICRIEGDSMLLCLADNPSIDRPERFECVQNSGLLLFELRRSKTSEPSR
jgi:uncharacterized protein (TIGR03067 family)